MSNTRITARRKLALVVVLGGGMALAPAAQALGSPGDRQNPRLAGTWQVIVDPGAPGGGDAFESTLSYSDAGQVMESTSLRTGVTEGLGSWEQVDRTTFRMVFQKYGFQNGAYVGKSVIRETITLVDGDTYEGVAVTMVTDPAGNTVATIPSRTTASRLTP